MTYLPLKARSECVAPSVFPVGGVVEIIFMFHAASPASQRPGLRPTRGSGVGATSDTIGSTGFGMTAGGGGGGGGGVPLPRPSPSVGAAADDPPAAGDACAAGGAGDTDGCACLGAVVMQAGRPRVN